MYVLETVDVLASIIVFVNQDSMARCAKHRFALVLPQVAQMFVVPKVSVQHPTCAHVMHQFLLVTGQETTALFVRQIIKEMIALSFAVTIR